MVGQHRSRVFYSMGHISSLLVLQRQSVSLSTPTTKINEGNDILGFDLPSSLQAYNGCTGKTRSSHMLTPPSNLPSYLSKLNPILVNINNMGLNFDEVLSHCYHSS